MDKYMQAQPGWWVVLYNYDGSLSSVHPVISWVQGNTGLIPVTWDNNSNAANLRHYLSEEFGAVIYYPKDDFKVRVLDETIDDYQLPSIDLEGA
ncbi:hypothetical protein FDQ50_18505 [Salmonella enterica]|uniref:Uncharacterized protein n=1 Tax=Salmonella typhisuis TaxID=41529 RepID=A0A735J062_SALTP|nr:hypothetical protein [Salmonella enterica]ECK9413477.1 hypothetical protein [Salmonella enterica subsp. enterica serovar Typhisuis str. CFSAN000655]ECU7962425.1 hypothetical protein [Salmonella enterica subsp. enterica serovar Newport]HAE6955630.1 hypothetical protein [Salmonella enterica subsp. enterica serovar Typhisuis]HBL7092756.1 hypothetical protein [Salmonella enterica subsp. enterica serovar Decatur]